MNVNVPSPLSVLQRLVGILILVYVSATMLLAGLIILICVLTMLLWSSLRIRMRTIRTNWTWTTKT